jgi:hypothetical protein
MFNNVGLFFSPGRKSIWTPAVPILAVIGRLTAYFFVCEGVWGRHNPFRPPKESAIHLAGEQQRLQRHFPTDLWGGPQLQPSLGPRKFLIGSLHFEETNGQFIFVILLPTDRSSNLHHLYDHGHVTFGCCHQPSSVVSQLLERQ